MRTRAELEAEEAELALSIAALEQQLEEKYQRLAAVQYYQVEGFCLEEDHSCDA